MPRQAYFCRFLLVLVVALLLPSTVFAQGIILPAAGAVNRGMVGATTGTAIDSIGSMYWNPATISQIPTDEMAFGYEVLYTNYDLSSTFPGAGSGSSEAENGAIPIPSMAWVHHTSNPHVTFGIGITGVAGFSVNMSGDADNPILDQPFAVNGTGVGGIKSDALFCQVAPALSLKMTDRLSVGVGPVIGMGKVSFDENVFVAMNEDNRYPRGDGTRYAWGLGAQLGFHYVHNCCWEFGANIKSPTWYEKFRYFSEDADGWPRTDQIDIDLPMIVSGGLAFKGFEYTILTVDVRYFDYTSTEGLGDSASYRNGAAVNGLGWNDLFAVATGAQFQLTDRLVGRVGYMFATDLIEDEDTFFNIASPLDYQHILGFGMSCAFNRCASVSAAYNYAFEYGSTGPYVHPVFGKIEGSSVTTELDVHLATIGLNVRY